jgi:hypothetical protein
MKTKVLIIAFTIIANILALHSIAQDSTKTLLGDETTITYNDKWAKIECDNDKIFYKLFTTHYKLIIRFNSSWKTDGKIMYKHYTLYLSKDDASTIVNWAKTNL